MSSAAIIHTLPYPALEAGNLSYPDGKYEAAIKMGDDGRSVKITHKITNAPFLESLITEGTAQFGCYLSVPKVGVRQLHLCQPKKHGQEMKWEDEINAEAPKLRPVLLYTGNERKHSLTKKDGVAEIWQGKEISLPEGAKLARGDFLTINSTEYALLRPRLNEEYEPGTFNVKPDTEGGFYFAVDAAPDIFSLLQLKQDPSLRQAILAAVVGQCFAILQKDYSEDDDNSIEDFPNLKVLRQKLQNELDCDWNDEGFDPLLAATRLYPVSISSPHDQEEEEE